MGWRGCVEVEGRDMRRSGRGDFVGSSFGGRMLSLELLLSGYGRYGD